MYKVTVQRLQLWLDWTVSNDGTVNCIHF